MIYRSNGHWGLAAFAGVLSLFVGTAALAGPGVEATSDTIGYRDDNKGKFFLKNENSGGAADVKYGFGAAGQGRTPVSGSFGPASGGCDINTNGVYKPDNGKFQLRSTLTGGPADFDFKYGAAGSVIALMGDWNNDGVDTPGTYDPDTGGWALRNSNDAGPPDIEFVFGKIGDSTPVVGDWDGQNGDSIGFFQPSNQKWKLRNTNSAGTDDFNFSFGPVNSTPITGDWNADGVDTIGVVRDTGKILLRNTNSPGSEDTKFSFGAAPAPNIMHITGDWDCS